MSKKAKLNDDRFTCKGEEDGLRLTQSRLAGAANRVVQMLELSGVTVTPYSNAGVLVQARKGSSYSLTSVPDEWLNGLKVLSFYYGHVVMRGFQPLSKSEFEAAGARLGKLLAWSFGYTFEVKPVADPKTSVTSRGKVALHFDGMFHPDDIVPSFQFFQCLVPAKPGAGGQTTFVHTHKLLQSVPSTQLDLSRNKKGLRPDAKKEMLPFAQSKLPQLATLLKMQWRRLHELMGMDTDGYGSSSPHLFPRLHVVPYGQMRQDPLPAARALTDFLGIPASDATLNAAVLLSDFDHMRGMERNGLLPSFNAGQESWYLKLTDEEIENSQAKVRAGKVGGYKKYFRTTGLACLDRWIYNAQFPKPLSDMFMPNALGRLYDPKRDKHECRLKDLLNQKEIIAKLNDKDAVALKQLEKKNTKKGKSNRVKECEQWLWCRQTQDITESLEGLRLSDGLDDELERQDE